MPPAATLVVALAGADVFGRPLDEDVVHRPERVIAVGGAKAGEAVGPALVAAVLADAAGGRKGVPAGARFWALINKVSAARLTAALLVERGVERVVLAEARSETAVVEVVTA